MIDMIGIVGFFGTLIVGFVSLIAIDLGVSVSFIDNCALAFIVFFMMYVVAYIKWRNEKNG